MTLPPAGRAAVPAEPPPKGFRHTAFFAPRRVALWADPALPESALLAHNLLRGGFRGELRTIGFRWDGFGGVERPEDLGDPPDVTVLALPPEAQEPALAAIAARGCSATVVPVAAPGLGPMARRHGVRAMGARSFGLALPTLGLNATLSHLPLRPGRLALLCQSGALARAVIDWAVAEDLGFSAVCGIGANDDYGFAGALDWLAGDATTGAVLLDLRHIKNRRAFLSAARAAARTRPVVAVRAGGGLLGEAAVADSVLEAGLRRAGVLRVEGLESLLSAAETLARLRSGAVRGGAGDRVAVVGNGRGPTALAADAVRLAGLRLAEIPEAAREMLSLGLPEGSGGANPLALPPGHPHRLADAAAMLAALREVDTVVAVHAPEDVAGDELALAAMLAAPRKGAPVLLGWLGQAVAGPQRRSLAQAGLPVFATPEAAVRGARHLAQDRANRAAAAELPPVHVLALAPDRAGAAAILARARAEKRTGLTEAESLALLDCYGLPTVARLCAASPEAAARAAEALGWPVAVKVLSPDLDRKTDFGGVALNLRDPDAVRGAGEAILRRAAAHDPTARLDGLLVQTQCAPGAELRLRVGDDPMFGPWIGFGAGGTAAEIDADDAFDLPPLNLSLARALVDRTRLARRLRGWRDHRAVDLGAIADALVRLSQMVVDLPEIRSATINPLLAGPDGVVALDAGIALRAPGEPPGVLAVAPYPADLSRPWTSADGRTLLIRPIRPEDAAAHEAAVRRLPSEDIRRRFFAPLRALPPAQTARLTSIDYDREMAFVAVENLPDEDRAYRLVGAARLVRTHDRTGEFAVVVEPRWKGCGLGRHLMERLFDWARGQGLAEIEGQVLMDNAPMVAFVRRLGFRLRRGEDGLYEARLDLGAPPS